MYNIYSISIYISYKDLLIFEQYSFGELMSEIKQILVNNQWQSQVKSIYTRNPPKQS